MKIHKVREVRALFLPKNPIVAERQLIVAAGYISVQYDTLSLQVKLRQELQNQSGS